MKIKMVMTAILAGLFSLSANADFERFSDPIGGMWVTPQNGDVAFGIFPFGVPDLQAITVDNRTFELIPNVNLYVDNLTNSIWRNNGGAGPDGNSVLEATTVFEITSLTEDVTEAAFTFSVDQLDIDLIRYQVQGFLKVLNPATDFSVSSIDSIPISGTGGPYTLFISTAGLAGQVLQAGWSITGLNANPTNDWGSVTVTASDLYTVSVDFTLPAPNPAGFAVEPYALSGTNITMTASNATDNIYDVEYLFTNTVNSSSSGWQSSPIWVDEGPAAGPPTTNEVDKITDPTFLGLNANWNGYSTTQQTPSTFVTASSGVATVTPGSSAEWDFFQEFTGVLEAGKTYEFSIDSANSTLVGATAVAFVKAFGPGFVWKGAEFQTVPLALDGSATSITIPAQVGTTIYQVGVFTTGATSGSYDVSNPTLTTPEVVQDVAGLTPDTEYTYQVKARDTSPNKNETDWSSPVSAISTVTDVIAPTPDPMGFAVEPVAISDTAISMTASNATDNAFGVEYLFTNTVNNTSSGWQSSPTWINVGELTFANAGFENVGDPGDGWEFNSGGASAGASTTNSGGNTSALLYANRTAGGGWAVAVRAITNITASGFNGGDIITVSAEIMALAGQNGGGAGFKVESWGGGVLLNSSGDQYVTVTESLDTYSVNYTVASGADEIRVVLLTVASAGTPDSYYLFDNVAVTKGVSLTPGTEYTYEVKARDTGPNANETEWSSPASATTTGLAPQTPFDVQVAGMTAGGAMVFSWQGTAGFTYGVQYKTNLITDLEWMTDLSPGASGILSAGGSISATSTVNSASVFYRIISE